MCSTRSRRKEYTHLTYKERYLVMWKSIGIAIILVGGVLVNTPAIAVDQTPTMARTSEACLSPPTAQLKMSATAIPASDSLKTLVKTLCSKGIELNSLQLRRAIRYYSPEVSRESSLSSIFPPKNSLTTVTIFYDEGDWSSKSLTSISARNDFQGIMILMVIATFISGTFGKSLVWRPASFGIVVGIIVGVLIGTVVSPLVAMLTGVIAGIFASVSVATAAGNVISPATARSVSVIAGIFGGWIIGFFITVFAGIFAMDDVTNSALLEWIAFCVGLVSLEFAVYFVRTFIRRKRDEDKGKQGVPVSN